MASQRWTAVREHWGILTDYQRFESSVALILTLLIATIILIALGRLIATVVGALMPGLDPFDHKMFQVDIRRGSHAPHRAGVQSPRCWPWPASSSFSTCTS